MTIVIPVMITLKSLEVVSETTHLKSVAETLLLKVFKINFERSREISLVEIVQLVPLAFAYLEPLHTSEMELIKRFTIFAKAPF